MRLEFILFLLIYMTMLEPLCLRRVTQALVLGRILHHETFALLR